MLTTMKQRYEEVCRRIAAAEEAAGREAGSVTLVAVTKTWPAETVLAAYEAGMRHFGENRVEELVPKRAEVEAVLGMESGIVWHLIGPLQSRKTRLAVESADVFHALDRLKIARRLSRQLEEEGRPALPTFVEVNVSGEGSKTGFAASEWETDTGQQQAILDTFATVAALPRIQIQGLMTMAPWEAPAGEIRRVFRRTWELARWLEERVPELNLAQLSMGMTDDFELAIAEGATHVRVGRAIFGERRY